MEASVQSLSVKIWGCRGSTAVCGPEYLKYGGNTTCYEILSPCLPPRFKLLIDAGSGIVQAGKEYMPEVNGGFEFVTLFTHYHLDHTLGCTLFKPIYHPDVSMMFAGPQESGRGPKDEIVSLFTRPRFPVDSESVKDRLSFLTLELFDVRVIVVHPKGGWQVFKLSEFLKIDKARGQIELNHRKYELHECLIIRMQRANHGNATCITYRFEERTTGKVIVICTDHENPDEIPRALLMHLHHADLLLMDAQYNQKQFMYATAGFGHGTPKGVVRQALAANVKKVLLIHHDPFSTDDYLENEILGTALHVANSLMSSPEFREQYGYRDTDVFRITESDGGIQLCADYQVHTA